MSIEAVYNEANLILATFPDFWAVDEDVYHLYGIVEKTGVKQFAVYIDFPLDFPANPPQVRVSKEIATLLDGKIDLSSLATWTPGQSHVVDVLRELKILIQKHLEEDFLDLKPAPKERPGKDYSDFATPEPFEFHGQAGGTGGLSVKPARRPVADGPVVRIGKGPAPGPDTGAVPGTGATPPQPDGVPEAKRWVDDGPAIVPDEAAAGMFDEAYWSGTGSTDTPAATTGDPARDARLREQADLIMMEYSVDQRAAGKVNVYLPVSIESTFVIPVDFSTYPERPAFDFPAEIAALVPDPGTQLATLRGWNPAAPPSVIDVIRELEGKLWAFNDIETRIKRIFGEFEAAYEPGSRTAVRVTILTYGFQEFHITVDLKDYPARPTLTYSPNLSALIKTPPAQLKVMQHWDESEEKEPVAILREINWLVDKESRMAFEIDLLNANLKGVRYDPLSKSVVVQMKGTMKTEERVFEFKAVLPDNYPMTPPSIAMASKMEEEDEAMGAKMEAALKGLLAKWAPASSYLIDAFNAVSKAIFEVSVISCIICHKFECPTCSVKLDSPDPDEGSCKVVCPYCERSYHKHCWDQTIATFGKCGFCLRPPPPNMIP